MQMNASNSNSCSLFSSSQSSQSQTSGSIDLFSDPPQVSQSTSQSQLSLSEYPSLNPVPKHATKRNEKYYMKYLSAQAASSALYSGQPSQNTRDKDGDDHEEEEDFRSWKTKSDAYGRRAILLDIIDTTRECKKEIEDSTSSLRKILENASSVQSTMASSMEAKFSKNFEGQSSILTNILETQQRTMEMLQALTKDSEMKNARLTHIESSIASLAERTSEQTESVRKFQQKIQELIESKVDSLTRHSHPDSKSQTPPVNHYQPTPHCRGSVKETVPSSPPHQCHILASSADSTTHLPADNFIPVDTFNDSGLQDQEQPISQCVKKQSPPYTRDPYAFCVSPPTRSKDIQKGLALKSTKPEVTSIRRKRRCSPHDTQTRKKRTKGKKHSSKPRDQYSPLITLPGDQHSASSHTITSHLRTIRTRSSVSKPSPVNALDDSFYSAVCYTSPYQTQSSSGSSTLISWEGRRQEQSKRRSQVVQPLGNESVLQELTATIMRHCSSGRSQNSQKSQQT